MTGEKTVKPFHFIVAIWLCGDINICHKIIIKLLFVQRINLESTSQLDLP